MNIRSNFFDDKTIAFLKNQNALKPALLSVGLEDGFCRCNICQHRCKISKGGVGVCRTIVNVDGMIYTTIYGAISSAAPDPIEKKPVFMFKPGTKVFSVGSLGCNFRCKFCQNWEIAYDNVLDNPNLCKWNITPSKLVDMAIAYNCQGIAFTYNEPSIWLNYTYDCLREAKTHNLYTVYVTNGYATPEHLDIIGKYLDVYRVDIKNTDPKALRELTNAYLVDGIFESTEYIKKKYNTHVECVTNIVPEWNDSEENITKIADWLFNSLGKDTPWHLTRFFPRAKMTESEPTPIQSLEKARDIARKTGLVNIFLGNV